MDEFYRRVLSDPGLAPFFEGVGMVKHRRKFLLFVSYVTGGAPGWIRLEGMAANVSVDAAPQPHVLPLLLLLLLLS